MRIPQVASTTTLAAAALGAALLLGGCGATTGAGSSASPAGGADVAQFLSLADDTSSAAQPADAPGGPTAGLGSTPGCSAQQRWTALANLAPEVRDYLDAHPDVAAELDHLRTLPAEQRRGELRSYLQAHPELRGSAQQLRDQVTHYRQTCVTG